MRNIITSNPTSHNSKKILVIITASVAAIGILGVFGFQQYEQATNLQHEKQILENKTKEQAAQQQALIQQQKQQAVEASQKQQQLEQQAAQQAVEAAQKQQELQQQAAQQRAQIQQQQQQAEKDKIVSMAQTNSFVRGLVNGQLNFYVPSVPSFADPSVQTTIDATAKALDGYVWERITLHRVYDINQADIIVQWVKNFGTDRAGQEVYGHVIEVGLGWDTCYGKWEPFNGYTVEKILWHEMGHALGFNHSRDSNNIMYGGADGVGHKFAVDLDERYFLANRYSQMIPFCNSGTYNFAVTNDNQYVGFNVYVIPPNTNHDDVIAGKAPYYVSCSTENKISFSGSCTVEAGSYMLAYNPYQANVGNNNMNVYVKIIDANPDRVPDFGWDITAFPYDQNWINYVWSIFHS